MTIARDDRPYRGPIPPVATPARRPRSRARAKAAGAHFERVMADHLAAAFEDERIDRRVTTGAKDRGDIGGVRCHGQRVVVECKNVRVLALPEWVGQAHVEAGNDDALVGVVIAKRHGTTDPGEQWVHCTVNDLVALITGQRAR